MLDVMMLSVVVPSSDGILMPTVECTINYTHALIMIFNRAVNISKDGAEALFLVRCPGCSVIKIPQ